MSVSSPSSRREFLRQTQNADGGWAYFPGKRSWLEPTLYATLALHGDPAADRSFSLIRSWALPRGGWRMSADLADANWTSALCLTVYSVRGVSDAAFESGLNRVLGTVGAEGSFLSQLSQRLNPSLVDVDEDVQGWPWRARNSSWVEPTVHSVVALQRVEAKSEHKRQHLAIRARLDSAEKMLLNRRCVDGGWNYGNRRVLDTALPSYPETTAIALLGLQRCPADELKTSMGLAMRYWRETQSPLARAWLTICLRNFGLSEPEQSKPIAPRPSQDILLAALQCLGEPGGGHQFLKTGVAA
jgi:squalene cyclase